MSCNQTKSILMVSPVVPVGCTETCEDNHFQAAGDKPDVSVFLEEFNLLAEKLKDAGVDVHVFEDDPEQPSPDAIYPNNWFSTHPTGELFVYPIKPVERRLEKRSKIIEWLKGRCEKFIDLSSHEENASFLEGTGSLVLDHEHKAAFAALSARTCKETFNSWCEMMDFKPILFTCRDKNGGVIYHTNIVMAIGDAWAVVCSESITEQVERESVIAELKKLDKEVVDISLGQMLELCGNIIGLDSVSGDSLVVMSEGAKQAFTKEQLAVLSAGRKIISSPIPNIAKYGGGGVRCMIAELF